MFFSYTKTFFKKNQSLYLTTNLKFMILAIDVGNTRIKTAVFEHDTILSLNIIENDSLDIDLKKILNQFKEVNKIIIASVSNAATEDFKIIFKAYSVQFITYKTQFPYINRYRTPETLGIDRMVLASGAVLLFPNTNRLIIDAGTCITFDYVDQKNNYLGGAISPGLRLRYKSLNNYTAKLPLLETKIPDFIIGNSTAEAIHSGVVNGLLCEIDGIINDFKAKNSNFIIILTGGDTEFLAIQLKNTIFANSNFLLESLNLLYIYNSKND